jgi:hypothetical protein
MALKAWARKSRPFRHTHHQTPLIQLNFELSSSPAHRSSGRGIEVYKVGFHQKLRHFDTVSLNTMRVYTT